MAPLMPVAVFGLEVPPGEIMIPAASEFPAIIHITMAALDPTKAPEADGQGNVPAVPRSTLKIIKATGHDHDDDDEDEDEYLQSLLGGGDSDDEANGGPSDPSKSKKAKQEAAIKKLMAATQEESDEEMEDAKPNGKKGKGKGKASESDDEESDEEDDCCGEDDLQLEDYVVCTLDTERNYQQPINITIGEGEKVFFCVQGTHSVYLTGNFVVPEDDEEDSEDDEDESDDEDYDFPLGAEEDDSDDMSDELDELDGTPRVKEITSEDEEEAPKLVDTSKKGKKRPAEDDAEGLDAMISKDDKKLSKKQQKKQKTEEVKKEEEPKKAETKKEAKSDKKVQFAKNLEQGPTGPAKDKLENKKPTSTVKVVQGVTIDDRKVGSGRAAKNGDRVGMRYIGKLQNGKVFDSNKKGAPFSFKLGKGEVIRGWDIGVAGMAVGGERRLTIPAHLAYGSRALPGIPANSTLIFDVKLLEIK